MYEEVRCAIYTRTSTDDRLNQELNSLDAQRLICEKYISNKQDWIALPKRYDDGDKSGENLKRPRVQELFRDIKRGEIDCVMVYRFDRLSRDTFDCARIDNFFKKYDIIYVSVTEPFDNKTAVGKLIKTVLSGTGQYERDVIVGRVKDKIAISKQNGMWMGGNVPMGYDVKDKKLIINQEEARVIEYIFARFIEIKSMAELARELNREGYRTKRLPGRAYGGNVFQKATVRGIITNPIYVGRIRHHDKEYKGQHKAIIDEEKWKKAQDSIGKRPRHEAKYEEVLLKGIIRCQLCNASMIPTYTKKPDKLYRYYVCDNQIESKLCPSRNRSISAGEVERIVIEKTRYVNSIRGSGSLEEIWENLFPLKQKEIIKKLVRMVWVREGGIELLIGVKELEKVREKYPTDMETKGKQGDCRQFEEVNGEISLFIPCKLRREAGRCMILEPENDQYAQTDNTLLKALVNAHLWQRQLDSGKYANLRELSEENKKARFPHRILKLNLLAPKIKEDILNGKQPRCLRLMDFRKNKIPLLWNEQLEKFYEIKN